MGAIDNALWDVPGQRCGVSLATLLGRHSDDVLPYASAGFYAPGKDLVALGAELKGLRDLGFRAFKMKVGRQRREWSPSIFQESNGFVGIQCELADFGALTLLEGDDIRALAGSSSEVGGALRTLSKTA